MEELLGGSSSWWEGMAALRHKSNIWGRQLRNSWESGYNQTEQRAIEPNQKLTVWGVKIKLARLAGRQANGQVPSKCNLIPLLRAAILSVCTLKMLWISPKDIALSLGPSLFLLKMRTEIWNFHKYKLFSDISIPACPLLLLTTFS